jgi:hypothetical protein
MAFRASLLILACLILITGCKKHITQNDFQGKWRCNYKDGGEWIEIFDGNSWFLKQKNNEQEGSFFIKGDELIQENISTTLIWEDLEERNKTVRHFLSIGARDVANEIISTGKYLMNHKRETHSTITFASPNTFFQTYTLILQNGSIRNNDALSGVTGSRCDRID